MISPTLTRRQWLAGTAGALALPAVAEPGYPNRPIELIVPAGAGGGTDALARALPTPRASTCRSRSPCSTAPAPPA